MIVISCQHETRRSTAKIARATSGSSAASCGKTFVDETDKPLGNMRISMKQATMALGMLLEGMSIRSVAAPDRPASPTRLAT